MKKTILFGLIIILCITSNGQLIDNYGLRVGAGLSNQYSNYKNEMLSSFSGWNDYKIGLIGQLYLEKNFGKYIAFRPTIGYIQKGFASDITFTTEESEEITIKKNNVVLHDLSIDLSVKIIPIDGIFKPYILLGLRGDYLLDYRSIIINFNGEDRELDTDLYDDFNKFTIGAIIGVGISYKELLFLDLEFNPALTKNFESDGLAINDRYFSATLGANINRLIKKKKS